MTISVCDYGAKPNSDIVQTEFFQKAIDACFLKGGGTVEVPTGSYIIGEIRLRSNITLYLKKNAVLLGSLDFNDYHVLKDGEKGGLEPIPAQFFPEKNTPKTEQQSRNWHTAMIFIYNAENVSIIGEEGSVLNGRNCVNPDGEEHYRGPHGINAIRCKNLTFKGYTFTDCGNWGHCIFLSKKIEVSNVRVLAGHDGLDIFGCDDVSISNCCFHTGDDCIAGFDNERVLIHNCEFNSSCSALRFSGADVLIKDCKAFGPGEYIHRNSLSCEEKLAGTQPNMSQIEKYRNNMLCFLLYYSDHRLPIRRSQTNFVVENCVVENCDRFIRYAYSQSAKWSCNKPMKDITFKNVKVSGMKIPFALLNDTDDAELFSASFTDCEFNFHKDFKNRPLVLTTNFNDMEFINVSTNSTSKNTIVAYGDFAGDITVDGGSLENSFCIDVKSLPVNSDLVGGLI